MLVLEFDTLNSADKDAVFEHLDLICSSPAFISSRRCQDFLRYVVAEVIEGRADSITERGIAQSVFGKGTDFEPEEFSLVRGKAGELRRRLAEYYRSYPSSQIRIELPVRTYAVSISRFSNEKQLPFASTPAPESILEPVQSQKKISRRRFLWTLGSATLAGAGTLSTLPMWRRDSPLEQLWQPIFATKSPLIVYIPVMKNSDGIVTEWVGMGPTTALSRTAEFLGRHHYPYRVRYGAELTFSQLQEEPSLMLGGFQGVMATRMLQNVRFVLGYDEETGDRAVIDTQTRKLWKEIWKRPDPYVDVDYGVLTRLVRSDAGQILMTAIGTQTFGTAGAASILYSPDLLGELLKNAPKDWQKKNFQAVVRVSIMGTSISPAQIVATNFW